MIVWLDSGRRSLRWAPSIFAALALAGCVTIESVAPTVTPALAAGSRTDATVLAEGRTIYTTRCTDCHNAIPVTRHTKAEWPEIIRRMAPESQLSAAQERAVLAYVLAISK
jgi:mono/diheme cytochrome c family protein